MRVFAPLLGVALLGLGGGSFAAEPPPSRPPRPTPLPHFGPDAGVVTSPEKARVMALMSQRTISSSKQFMVFSSDATLRSRVATFTEEVKASLLQILGEPDRWKNPIIVTLEQANPTATQPPAVLSLFQHEAGFKIQIDVHIGADPAEVNLQKHLIHALLLELTYRDRPEALQAGTAFQEPPWWLVEGAAQIFRHKETGLDPDLFKRIIDVNRLPPIAKFLTAQPLELQGGAMATMDQACAMCLVQLLVEQPEGRTNLASLVRHRVDKVGDSVGDLLREFPALGKNEQSLQKWWTVNLARFSATDRYKGLTSEGTETQLNKALQLEISSADGATRSTFQLADYTAYLKLPGSRPALAASQSSLVELSSRANALYRPVLAEYAEIMGLLARGKTRGLRDRLTKVEVLRGELRQRMTSIADYLNWYEATQTETRSGKFDGYLKAARELDAPTSRQDPLSRYLDQVEKDL